MILAALLTAGASLVLFGSGFFNFLTPFPVSLLAFRKGLRPTVVAVFLSLVCLYLLYRFAGEGLIALPGMIFFPHWSLSQIRAIALVSFFYYVWIGLAVIWLGNRKISWEKGVGGIALSAILLSAVLFLGLTGGDGLSVLTGLRGALTFLLDRLMQLNPALSSEEQSFLSGPFVETFLRLLPAVWILMTVAVVALNLLLLRRWVSRNIFSPAGEFPLWRIREEWIWVPVGLGTLTLLNHYLWGLGWLSWGLVNGLLVVASLYFFQGLSIGLFIIRKNFSPVMQLLMFLLFLLLSQPLSFMLILLGLFDFWFDFRKIKKGVAHANHS